MSRYEWIIIASLLYTLISAIHIALFKYCIMAIQNVLTFFDVFFLNFRTAASNAENPDTSHENALMAAVVEDHAETVIR